MPSRRRGPGKLGPLLASLLLAAGASASPPTALRDLRLQDHSARPIEPASLEGRVLLLNFVFTGCSSTCPLQTHELALLRRSLPAQVRARAEFLSVSVDPLNDTPDALAAFARRMGADQPGWRFATGAPAQVETLLARMQVMDPRRQPPAPADHRSSLWLFDHSGALVQRFAGAPIDRARLADEIGRLALRSGP
jgi:protein SCO1/2